MTAYDKMSRDELLDALKVRDERDRRAQEATRTSTIQFKLDWTPGGDVPTAGHQGLDRRAAGRRFRTTTPPGRPSP